MKKLFLLSSLIVFGFMLVQPVSAEPTDKQIKMAKTDAAKRAKELTKDGWKIGSSMPMEVALQQHYLKLEAYGGEYREINAMMENKESIDVGTSEARNAAARYFTQDAKSFIEGKAASMIDIKNNEGVKNFNAYFEQQMITEMNGTLVQSFILFRPNQTNNTKKDVMIFYVYKCDTQQFEGKYDEGIKDLK